MTETETREFDLADILSVTTGILLSHRHVDGVYEILSHMTGQNLFTHQLPAAADRCKPVLLEQHPQLAAITVPDTSGDVDALLQWLATQEAAYGTPLEVTPLDDWVPLGLLDGLPAHLTEGGIAPILVVDAS